MTRGTWTRLDGEWANPTAMCGLGDRLYIADGGSIWRVDAEGAYEELTGGDWRSRFLVGAAGVVVAIEPNGGMYRVQPTDGQWTQLDGDWRHVTAPTAGGDAVYVIERSGTLYRAEPSTGSYSEIEGDFRGHTLLVAAGGALITVDPTGRMYRVSAHDGSWQPLEDTWTHCRAAAGDDQNLYVVSGETLYAVDPRTGTYAPLGEDPWSSKHLALMGGALYSLEPDGGLYRISL